MHLFLGATLDSYCPDDYLCGIIHPNSNSQTMWVIKHTNPSLGHHCYLFSMFTDPSGFSLAYNTIANAFRFPDEATAQAVLKFLNRENLEVVCISGSK